MDSSLRVKKTKINIGTLYLHNTDTFACPFGVRIKKVRLYFHCSFITTQVTSHFIAVELHNEIISNSIIEKHPQYILSIIVTVMI